MPVASSTSTAWSHDVDDVFGTHNQEDEGAVQAYRSPAVPPRRL